MAPGEQARNRLKGVVNSIAQVEEGACGLESDDVMQANLTRGLEELRREKDALTAEILQVLGIRPGDAWPETNAGTSSSEAGAVMGGVMSSSSSSNNNNNSSNNNNNNSNNNNSSSSNGINSSSSSSRGFGLFPRPECATSHQALGGTAAGSKGDMLLPRLLDSDLEGSREVRARRQHQLPRPPPLRASTFLQQVDGAGATGTDYDGDVRSGELLPPPFDRASTISSHPWSRPAVATSSLSATGGSGADTGFDAGAGWGNIIDDLHTTPNAFGYGSAGMDASSSSSAPTSSGISSDATMVRGGSGGARHSQHHTNSAALSETASSHSRKRRAPSSPTSAPSAAAAAAAAAVVAAASVHSPTSGPNDGDRAPALLPNLSALYNTNRAHVSTSGMSVGGETDGAGDRGSSGDHASSGLAWHALGAAASRVGSSATNGSGSSYDTAGLPPPPRETGHRRMLPSALEPDHYYSSQLPVVHPRYMVGQTMNTSAGTRVGRSSSSGVGGGASSGGYNLSVDTQSPTMASPYAMHSSSFVTGNLQASGEENRGLGDARVTDSISAMRRAQAVAAGGDIGGDLGAAGWRQQPARAEQRRRDNGNGTGPTTTASKGRGCQAEDCDRRPIYAYKGSKKAAYCAKHRVAGMVDTRHPLCKDEQCTRQPSFGMEGDRRASYCAEHKLTGMINVASRRCQHPGCLRHPNFGFTGDRRASYCSGHRETGMVDIVSRRCREPGCNRRPLYNMDGLRPVCCSQHKTPGMIDVVSTRCQEQGCFCHPSFGYASDNKARRCARHRLEGMVGVKGHRQKRKKESAAAAEAAKASASPTAGAPLTNATAAAAAAAAAVAVKTAPGVIVGDTKRAMSGVVGANGVAIGVSPLGLATGNGSSGGAALAASRASAVARV